MGRKPPWYVIIEGFMLRKEPPTVVWVGTVVKKTRVLPLKASFEKGFSLVSKLFVSQGVLTL